MKHYLVTLDFSVNYAECKQTPEAIVEQAGNMILEMTAEAGETRRYTAVLSINSEVDDGLTDQLESVFSLLPGYVRVSCDVDDQGPTDDAGSDAALAAAPAVAGPDIKQFNMKCHFWSEIPFLELRARFDEHIADGNLVGNGTKPREYVAFVNLSAVSDDSLDDAVETLLARAFQLAQADTRSSFRPIRTTLCTH